MRGACASETAGVASLYVPWPALDAGSKNVRRPLLTGGYPDMMPDTLLLSELTGTSFFLFASSDGISHAATKATEVGARDLARVIVLGGTLSLQGGDTVAGVGCDALGGRSVVWPSMPWASRLHEVQRLRPGLGAIRPDQAVAKPITSRRTAVEPREMRTGKNHRGHGACGTGCARREECCSAAPRDAEGALDPRKSGVA